MGAFIGSASAAAGIGAGGVSYQCNYRNLVDSQVAVKDRVPLQIDGKHPQGQFNTFAYPLWNPETSRITPGNLFQVFDARILLTAKPTVGGSILTVQIDRSPDGVATKALVYTKDFTLSKLEENPLSDSFNFYISQSFLNNGGKLWVSCTDPAAITNVSLWLFLKGGRP